MYTFAPHDSDYWAREIEKLAPPNDRLASLKVTWRPDWQRFCVWQLFPKGTAPATTWGPDTPLVMRVESKLGKRVIRMAPDQRLFPVLNRQAMTWYAWQIHLETGGYPQPFWVVEGKHGGHKWQFSEEQSRLLGMAGLPEQAPEPGSQPYAPVDRRTFEMLEPLDMLKVWDTLSKAKDELDERDLDIGEKDAMQVARQAYWNWTTKQIDHVFDEAEVRVAGHPGAGYRDADAGYEEAEEAFMLAED